MKRARLALSLAAIGTALLGFFPPAAAQEIVVPPVLVKQTRTFTMDARFGSSFVGVDEPNCRVEFTPGRRTTPAAAEPVHTADPRIPVRCKLPLNLACSGWCQFHVAMRTLSLNDIGTYRIRCTVASGRVLDTRACPLIECRDGVICPVGSLIFDVYDPRVYTIEVYNNPPLAAPVIPSTGHVREVLRFESRPNDIDRTGFGYDWRLTPPAGAPSRPAVTNTADITFTPMSHLDIGTWNGVLRIVDAEGEMGDFPFRFTIQNREPAFEIGGPRMIRALEPIRLSADPGTDPDGDPRLRRSWELVSVPRGASRGPGTLGDARAIEISTTGPNDVGNWEFVCTQTDGHGAAVRRTATVVVQPRPPAIELEPRGAIAVRVGDPVVRITDRVVNDAYGRPLSSFRWVLHQVPVSAGVPLGTYDSDPAVEIPTHAAAAGTWILRLTVTDASGSTADERVSVHVDAAPVARIIGPDAAENLATAVSLGGDTSTDPDSPEDSIRGHLADIPREVSDAIASYTWRVTAVPGDSPPSIQPGTVDEVFPGGGGRRPTLFFPPRTLPPGHWQFALDVRDAERWMDTATHSILITDAQTPPLAVLGEGGSHLADVDRHILADVVIDGSNSYDPDELLTTSRTPGLGLDHYTWTVIGAPPACTTVPDLPDGATATTATLYRADEVIPAGCLGTFTIELMVRDTDSPTVRTGRATTTVTISNCPRDICIDFPNRAMPLYVRSSDRTDVMVNYHLSSSLYDRIDLAAGTGLRLHMLIVRDRDSLPVYLNSWDLDLLPTDRGGRLALHWHGLTHRDEFPETGMYGIVLQVTDSTGAEVTRPEVEPRAIWIETLEVGLTTPRYVDRQQLTAGPGPIRLAYALTGTPPSFLGFDEARFTIYRRGGAAVRTITVPASAASGDLRWDGRDESGATVPAADYEAAVELLDHGARLATSARQRITVYELTLTAGGTALSGSRPGLYVMVNSDDDNLNGTVDSAEAAAGENDLVDLLLTMAPPAIEGSVAVSMPAPSRGALYARADKSAPLPARVGVPPGGLRLYAEGTSPGAGTISVALEPTGAPAQPAQPYPVTVVEVVAVNDTSGDFVVGAGDTVAPFVRLGLWDRAFDGAGRLRNENDAEEIALGSPPDNFVGRDSRRFYFRITDPSANADSSAIESIAVPSFSWWTLDAAGADADHPAHPTATLRETAVDSGVFATAAVMVVSDGIDAAVPTQKGLPGQIGGALRGEADHRTRSVSHPVDAAHPEEIASPDGSIVATYAPRGTPGPVLSARLPLFSRNPEERRVIDVRWFNFGDPPNGVLPIDPRIAQHLLETIRQRFVVMGVRVNIHHNPATDVINLPVGAGVNLNDVPGSSPSGSGWALSPEEIVLANLVNAAFPRTPANQDVIRLVFVGRFTMMDDMRGEAIADAWNVGGIPHSSFVFIAGNEPRLGNTAPHEIGHLLLDDYHYTGLDEDFNLMRDGTIDSLPPRHTDSRRIWNDASHAMQINIMLMRRFIHP